MITNQLRDTINLRTNTSAPFENMVRVFLRANFGAAKSVPVKLFSVSYPADYPLEGDTTQ